MRDLTTPHLDPVALALVTDMVRAIAAGPHARMLAWAILKKGRGTINQTRLNRAAIGDLTGGAS